jgi:hypothetical protein
MLEALFLLGILIKEKEKSYAELNQVSSWQYSGTKVQVLKPNPDYLAAGTVKLSTAVIKYP